MEELAKQMLEKLKDSERLAAVGATAGMVGHDIITVWALVLWAFAGRTSIGILRTKAAKINAIENNIFLVVFILTNL